ENQVAKLSPSSENGYQLRRIVRYLKYFSRVHSRRLRAKLPCGLVLTALCIENYVPKNDRDDESLYETLKRLQNRPDAAVYANGVVVSGDKDADRIRRLREAAKYAAEALAPLEKAGVTEKDARSAWKDVFRHSYFDKEGQDSKRSDLPAPAVKRS